MRAIIVVNNLGYVGFNGGLPWKCKSDLLLFKQLTLTSNKGNEVPKLLVGHNTSQTLPTLSGRNIFVNTTNCTKLFRESDIDWCIGGKRTYERFCHLFTELHISHIDDDTIGDVMFPDLRNLNPECKIFHYYFNVDKET